MIRRGVLLSTEQFDAGALADVATSLEARGYDSAWLPELFGREPIATAGYLLAKTERIAVATGIANVRCARKGRGCRAPAAPERCPTYIAAHGPQLQALGARRTDGVITYLMTPQHVRLDYYHRECRKLGFAERAADRCAGRVGRR